MRQQYLVRRKKNDNYKLHYWNGQDTACRMYSTGGIRPDKYQVVSGEQVSSDKICHLCSTSKLGSTASRSTVDGNENSSHTKTQIKAVDLRPAPLINSGTQTDMKRMKRNDWAWKPPESDEVRRQITKNKIKKTKGARSKKGKAAKKLTAVKFYKSWEWKKLRYNTLVRYGAVCMLCNSTIEIVVDHIKPRSKFPELELDPENAQVLCNSCNMGKSNNDYTDFRPKISNADIVELEIVRQSNDRI